MYTAVVDNSISPEQKAELESLRQENEGLRRHLEDSDADILKSLRTLPEDEALLLLYRLRATALGGSNAVSPDLSPHLHEQADSDAAAPCRT